METLLEKKSVNETQIATFHIGKELFGIGIHRIKEIVRYPEITHVPRSTEYLKGLTNLRGNVLPVLDARIRLNLPVAPVTDRTRVLVLDVNESLIGVIVDSVKGVASLENVRVETPPPILSSGVDSKFIHKVIYAKDNEGITLELNVDSLCNIDVTLEKTKRTHVQQESVETDKKNAIAEKQLVTFLVGLEEYGFTIQSVQEILRVSKITEVPEVPAYVLGVLALRNELLPIIDLRKLFGMPSLVENKLQEIERLEKSYQNWFSGFKYSFESDSGFRSIETVDALQWIESFRTSSEEIGKILQKVRFIHQDIHFHSQNLFKTKDVKTSDEIKSYLEKNIQSGFEQLLLTLSDCKEGVKEDIKEDQRILVADINKNSIGIMVDRMQQVIRIPENIIDPPPRIIHGDKEDNLQGIVKLDEGKRLILFLDEKKLFNEKLMSRILDVKQENVSEKEKEAIHGGESLQEAEVQLVTFRLGKEEFGLYIEDVREINRLTGVTAVPNSPSFVEGIMNLRGNVIPAIDLRKRFNLEIAKHGEATRVIIVDILDKTTGLIVDSVSEVIRISRKLIEPPPEIISSKIETEFIDGIANLAKQGRFIIILNVDKILSGEEQQQLKETARVGV